MRYVHVSVWVIGEDMRVRYVHVSVCMGDG